MTQDKHYGNAISGLNPTEIEVYHLDHLSAETEFDMDIKVCQREGHFNNKVALEYVVLGQNTDFRPHYHDQSDALLLILRGCGYITDGAQRKYLIQEGSLAYIPAKTRHGFITGDQQLHFIVLQSPPIKNLQSGEIDFVP